MTVVQVQSFACLIPPATPAAAPATVPMQLGIFTVEWVEWEVPDGPNGNVGFYIASSGQQVFPFRIGSVPNWIVTSGTFRHWDLEAQPNSGDWSLVGYNTGANEHTVYVSWGLSLVAAQVGPVPILDPAALSG